MRADIDELLKQVRVFSEKMLDKGWEGAFHTNGGYPDEIRYSLEKYLYQSMLGNEPGFGHIVMLSTYAKFSAEESVTCSFNVRLGAGNALMVSEVDITHRDSNVNVLNFKKILITDQEQVPTCHQAIDAVIPPKEKLSVRPGRKGIKR